MACSKPSIIQRLTAVSLSIVGLVMVLVWHVASAAGAAVQPQVAQHSRVITGNVDQVPVTPTVGLEGVLQPDRAVATRPAAGEAVYRQFLPMVAYHYGSLLPPFGVQNYYALTPQYGFTRIVESKVSWVRFPVYWSSVESTNTTPANYNWSGADTSLLAVKNTSANLVVTLAGNPGWAASSVNGPVYNLADLQEFVGAIVARYPHVKYWEFYNEPDNEMWYGQKGAAYATMLRTMYPVVKAANPSANVVMGGLALDWFSDNGGPFDRNFLRDVLANCSGPCFDVANFHYYPAFRSSWESYGRDIIGKANYVRQMLATYHYERPIFSTETAWPSATTWGSPELQARYVPKVYVRSLAADLPVVMWFSLFDADYSDSGLLDDQLVPRPAYTAMRTLINTMPRPHYVRTIPASETGSASIEAYQFSVLGQSGPERLDVYWYDCPSMVTYGQYPADCNASASVRLKVPQVARIDKLGNRTTLNAAADGYVTLNVQSSPIYIDYTP